MSKPVPRNTSLEEAYEASRRIHEQHGKSYYFATRFLPEDLRRATFALYAFFRLPDEIVDNPKTSDPRKELEQFREDWRSGRSAHPVLVAAKDTFERFHIPFEYSESFLDAMIQDTWKDRYRTYGELEEYMYGSAAVVGLMMSHVIGFDVGALAYAEKLGYAMQLTNFLRDIKEDYQQRGRIYLPQEELTRFSVLETDLAQGNVSSDFIELMKFQIKRADTLYEEANKGIHLLKPRGRFAVRAASDLYRAILRKIENQHYDVFQRRASTSRFDKILIVGCSRFRI